MFSIHVERIIEKPIDEVFEILADHAKYSRFKGIEKSTLIKEGESDKNGLGAIREICASGSTLHEEIVAFEPPFKLGYKIVFSKPLPYDHQLGEVVLSEVALNEKATSGEEKMGTKVVWRSQGTITTPIIGRLIYDRQIQKMGARAFGSILKTVANM